MCIRDSYSALDLATPQAFKKDPNLVWNWYKWRMQALLTAKPNPGHDALVKLEKMGLSLGIITQNVDGLINFGNSSEHIVEIHGRIRYAHCTKCDHIQRWDSHEYAVADDSLLYCPYCKDALLRPDVVWFGESINPKHLQKAMNWIERSTIMLVIGTSGTVYPVANFPHIAKQQGTTLIEFNVTRTPLTPICDYFMRGPSEQTLPKFVDALLSKKV